MNELSGRIKEIKKSKSISLVKVQVEELLFSAIVIDTPETAPYLKINNPVKVVFKETEVVIALEKHLPISLQNRMEGKINAIDKDELLCRLTIETNVGIITSIITANAVNQLNLKEGQRICAMVKTNEIMLYHD
ncbi:TOBE domain-containing protein [Namhaeicola litoreus]|uniref:Molybdopterin-binding protein n=1 Tax=Namhaeicola litoreus TaxID=1052145 RepID=A0ABW3Y2S4_9FLAO